MGAKASPSVISPTRLVFNAKQQVALEAVDLPRPGVGQVLARAVLTLMSTGTENIVFNRLFDAGTHYDRWVKYPFYPGYSAVGVVEEVGENCALVRGQRVAWRGRHASHAVLDSAQCFPIPDGIDFEQAAWFALAKIAFMGAKAAQYRLGDSVLIIGAGPIGQMSVRWAAAAGARVIMVADPVESRLSMARAGGATAVFAKSVEAIAEDVRAANAGALPRVVIDGTGHADVFASALSLAADRGTVVVLGDTGTPAKQHLTSDIILRGLAIVGAHDGHTDATWNEATISRLFFDLMNSDRFRLKDLNTHRFSSKDCADAYDVANRKRGETMGIIFDWSKA